MYPGPYSEHMTGDPAYDKAFAALADCPSFAQVEQALKTHAHELAEKIRYHPGRVAQTRNSAELALVMETQRELADLIDPNKESTR